MGGEQVFFFFPGGIQQDIFVFSSWLAKFFFPEIPHLLLKSNKAPVFLLLSPITPRG